MSEDQTADVKLMYSPGLTVAGLHMTVTGAPVRVRAKMSFAMISVAEAAFCQMIMLIDNEGSHRC